MQEGLKKRKWNKTLQRMWKDRYLYLLISPTILYFLIFRVWPIINMRLAFFDYKARGPWEFAGLKYFKMIFSTSAFASILKNTLILSFMKYVLLFPFFVIFALMLTELRRDRCRKYVQVVSYLPHFLSWVVIAGIWMSFLAPSDEGGLNQILSIFGLGPVDLLTSKKAIRWILMLCEGWRSLGWDSIIYFTTIIGIDVSLYEAAKMDGANKWQIIRHIDLPGIMPTVTMMLIMEMGKVMNIGFQKAYLMQNGLNIAASEIIPTYIYKIGLIDAQYSYSAAISLFNNIINIILLVTVNKIAQKTSENSLW